MKKNKKNEMTEGRDARNTGCTDVFVFYTHIIIIGGNRSRCYERGMRYRHAHAQRGHLSKIKTSIISN